MILLLLMMMINVSSVVAEPVQIEFKGGFTVRLSEEWIPVETTDDMKETGSFSTVVSRDGESFYEISYTDHVFAEPEYETEIVHWFKDDVTNLIPKGAHFTVKDIGTGKTFEAFRYDGRNHMDSEPLSVKDSNIIKEIYGGQYSWDFRPVLVRYEGHVYAASMNGMPHAKGTVNENGFDGHFCIHFQGSYRHEEWVVSDVHQALVLKAAEAVW